MEGRKCVDYRGAWLVGWLAWVAGWPGGWAFSLSVVSPSQLPQVAEVVSVFPGVEEVNVYGVELPNADGRACCASLVASPNLDYAALAAHCNANLPAYAMPLFLRKLPQIEITGTFKHQKVELRTAGVDPTLVKDEIMVG